MRRVAIALIALSFAVGACANDSMPRRVSRGLREQVATIRTAVELGDVAGARDELRDLDDHVIDLRDEGVLSEGTALEILDAAEAVRANLTLAPSPSPTETATPPPSTHRGAGRLPNGSGAASAGPARGRGLSEPRSNARPPPAS